MAVWKCEDCGAKWAMLSDAADGGVEIDYCPHCGERTAVFVEVVGK